MAMIRVGRQARAGQARMKFSTLAVAFGAVAAAALFAGGPYAFQQWVQSRAKANRARAAQHYAERNAELHPKPATLATAPPFTRVQVVTFLEHAQVAEAITDPLQRCLAYPDPPGSHWSPAAVRAYCHYRYQPVLGMDAIKQLIHSGQTAKLDQLLTDALKAQQTDPDARGRLDRIYESNFDVASPEVRKLVDAWKRQDPGSAFAWAASGVEYAAEASTARGNDLITNTPASAIASMDKFAHLADADLQHALTLNPHIAPAYRQMIRVGEISLGDAYAMAAVKRGLAEAPDDLGIYDQWMWLEQPNWYGSYAAMDAVALHAAGRVTANPLLVFEVAHGSLYKIRQCDCTDAETAAQYRAVAKQFIGYGDLYKAGNAAQTVNDLGSAGIYYAEALRFNEDDRDAPYGFSIALSSFGFKQWALTVAKRAVAEAPHDEDALGARGLAYGVLGQFDASESDFKAAVAINPDYDWAWTELAHTYTARCEWDKAWQIANRLVEKDPSHADGLELRAIVQVYEPRLGLADTAANLKQHFGSYPEKLAEVRQIEAIVQKRDQQRAQAAREHKPWKPESVPPPWFHQCRQYAHLKLVPEPRHG